MAGTATITLSLTLSTNGGTLVGAMPASSSSPGVQLTASAGDIAVQESPVTLPTVTTQINQGVLSNGTAVWLQLNNLGQTGGGGAQTLDISTDNADAHPIASAIPAGSGVLVRCVLPVYITGSAASAFYGYLMVEA